MNVEVRASALRAPRCRPTASAAVPASSQSGISDFAPSSGHAAYERERTYSRKVERLLTKAVNLLDMECSRREGRGEDVAHIRAFIGEAQELSL
jgi:hypothetical protein